MAEKVVYFTGCFSNYYRPETGRALLSVLKKNAIEVLVPKQKCCGLPMLANGNVGGAKKNFTYIVQSLSEAASPGHHIITTCPSCQMMLKKEGPAFFDSDEARFVSGLVVDAGEYLLRLHGQGRLNTNFQTRRDRLFYHIPCHLKVQNLTKVGPDLLGLIPGLSLVKISANCCGMGGSYGMKKVNFERSVKIAQKVWEEAKGAGADLIATECGGCALQIEAGTGIGAVHPLVILSEAYK